MSRGGIVVAGWGGVLMLLALLGVVAFGIGTLPAALLVGAGALAMLWGAAFGFAPEPPAASGDGSGGSHHGPRPAPRESVASLGIAASVPLIITGLIGVGSVFAAVGAALLVLSVYALVGEGRP